MNLLKITSLLCLSVISVAATGQEYPNKPIRMVLPYGPGGGFDNAGRPMAQQMSKHLGEPIVVDRVRQIAGEGFGFLPHRFLQDGFLSALPPDALVLYVFLVLAANRVGVSFHRYDAICSVLGFHLDRYLQARNALIDGDLMMARASRSSRFPSVRWR